MMLRCEVVVNPLTVTCGTFEHDIKAKDVEVKDMQVKDLQVKDLEMKKSRARVSPA
ncbi:MULTISPECIES: hypothetical protein [unclassified Bradyrhizobium]|uniref:hypothetical protein n=1 Tax=unclassified Bradyrhizobium TaxID=2631580 RepID=UPI001BAC177B|nr:MULTISPECIES: hypothetical protein [unclassified Bradyrhizobium]MBR1203104.1 hypothetical protein [Bradyrhizobium sp. AUGA SZCCT0124]MBR1312767.1 hypothetical protein [Bradyrhizobium sp. AUGA SZCCT0051]MBR1341125.1 hypothetical protein [Bradyrhizobium sp. AUGA SZCCT0105]MBR1356937.1 hypothetical protein [Bradyrhizobium sp. AUGA SZCCT0045]